MLLAARDIIEESTGFRNDEEDGDIAKITEKKKKYSQEQNLKGKTMHYKSGA